MVHNARVNMLILTSMFCLGAFLLFSMEPLIGRLLTPLLGGAAHVWLVCLMFYQAMLFAGYLYAHLFARKLGVWHLAILFLPLFMLPFDIPHLPNVGSPIGQLFSLLLVHAALPFVVLSTTAVVAQAGVAFRVESEAREGDLSSLRCVERRLFCRLVRILLSH